FLVGLRGDGSSAAALRNGGIGARVDGGRVGRSVVSRATVLSGGGTERCAEDVIEETLAHQLIGDDPRGFVLLGKRHEQPLGLSERRLELESQAHGDARQRLSL